MKLTREDVHITLRSGCKSNGMYNRLHCSQWLFFKQTLFYENFSWGLNVFVHDPSRLDMMAYGTSDGLKMNTRSTKDNKPSALVSRTAVAIIVSSMDRVCFCRGSLILWHLWHTPGSLSHDTLVLGPHDILSFGTWDTHFGAIPSGNTVYSL